LMVQAASGGEILVPFARAYLAEIDLDGKRIEMRLPEGLLDINAPMSEEECQALNTTKEDE